MEQKIIVETVCFNPGNLTYAIPQKIHEELENGYSVKEMNIQPFHDGRTFPVGVAITALLQKSEG